MNPLRTLSTIALLLTPPLASGQLVSLGDFLPYSPGQTSTLESPTGFTLEFSGTNIGFNWTATHPALEGIRERFRFNSGQGLTLLGEEGVAAGSGLVVYTETYEPAFFLFPPNTQLGHSLNRNGSYHGNEPGESWQGTAENITSIEATEVVTTPAGVFDTVRFKIESQWTETGTGFTADGTTTQTWWMASGVGIVKVLYEFEETVEETGELPEAEEGELEFTLTASSLLEPPTIVTHPEKISIFAGQEARFQVAATGPGTLTYQWLKDDAAIPGASQFTYVIPSAQISDGGVYTVEVTNHNGTTTSNGATLTVEDAPIVNIPDFGLKDQILRNLGRADGDVTQADLESLTTLTVERRFVADLTGLEFATNLTALNLKENRITDLSPLAGLTNLTSLRLQTNMIADTTPLAGLVNLRTLVLAENQISDLSPIANLTQLTVLWMWENQIADISVLANMPDLWNISFNSNSISDLTPISEIVRLQEVGFHDNNIREISALANLVNLKSVQLGLNEVTDVSPIASHLFIEHLGLNGNQIVDISMLGPYSRLRSVTVQNNFLDIAPESANRTIIDGWLAQGAFVQFEPQNVAVAAPRMAVAAAANGRLQLSWNSVSGIEYAVETTPDGETWTPSGAPLAGTGGVLTLELPIKPGQTELFRVQAIPVR